ncbi:MAG: hypothetical protein KAR37_09320 [Alphaproteobacteria bacterium]|nr:hypothetical protein [Alphaproteobacteria bacterium]
MAKKVALLSLHGMGDTPLDYHETLSSGISNRLGDAAWSQIHFGSIFYQNILQPHQDALFERVRSKIDYKKMRKYLLSGFSDAGGLEYSRQTPDSAYEQSQERIFEALGNAFVALGNTPGPVVFIAQSLGCQVLSNYIWDADRHADRPDGIWRHDHDDLAPENLEFRKLKSLRVLVTTGCNIPIFVGGLPYDEIIPFQRPNDLFVWENYYDEDDVLGWPLQDLSPGYETLVKDIQVNSGGLFTSWNPLSHEEYWGDEDVQIPLTGHLQSLL